MALPCGTPGLVLIIGRAAESCACWIEPKQGSEPVYTIRRRPDMRNYPYSDRGWTRALLRHDLDQHSFRARPRCTVPHARGPAADGKFAHVLRD